MVEHVPAAGPGQPGGLLGSLGDEGQALLELQLVLVEQAGVGTLAVPAHHRTGAVGHDQGAGQPRLHDRAREALVAGGLHVGGGGGEGVVAVGVVEEAEVDHPVGHVGWRPHLTHAHVTSERSRPRPRTARAKLSSSPSHPFAPSRRPA